MYLLDTESYGNIFFPRQQTTQPICKVSRNKDLINFSGVTGFLAFSFPSSSFVELVALSHFFSMSVEVSPPKQHTQASREAMQVIGPPGLGHHSPLGLPPVLCSGLEETRKWKCLPTDCCVLERKPDEMKVARGS